jgi:uncharacterized protein
MKAENVAEYLQKNPDFFNEHAGLLADLVLPHPHGGRTISLSERQLLVLRERVKDLEKKLFDWMDIAKENEALQNKVHRYALALFSAHDSATLQEIATRNLREIFSVPHAVIHLWQAQPPSAEIMAFADQHTKPVCVHQAVHDTQLWFGEVAEHLHSYAYLPLRHNEQSIGMLILASEEAQRFYPEMGTVFLQRIAELVSHAAQPPSAQ